MATSKSKLLRNWFAGAIVAAFTAVLIQTMTGAFTWFGSSIKTIFISQNPIQVSVSSDFVSFNRQGELSYLIPRPINQIPPSPKFLEDPIAKFDPWAASLGAVDAERTYVEITVTGRSATPVILTNLRVKVMDRQPPLSGIFVRKPTAGDVEMRCFSVDLDTAPPTIKSVEEDYSDEKPLKFPYSVTATETEVFHIEAHTEKYDCTWVAELFWTTGDKKGSTIIKNNGKPFRTTSVQNAPIYHFGGDGVLHKFDKVRNQYEN